jgi:cytochrome d ubiquinol oxidase subunit I
MPAKCARHDEYRRSKEVFVDAIILSRLQFAATTIFHFFFVPLTLGLAWLVFLLEAAFVLRRNETYRNLARFWGKLLVINFALGVVTGIVLEFQFGMNWALFADFIGDIFGVPLAIEALLTFFLESTFLGIWIFGWKRLSPGLHAAAIGLVALGSTLSALWILTANGFMQHPVGYELAGGRARLVDALALVTNPRALLLFWHALSAGFVTGSFFMLGVSAWHLARGHEAFRFSFRLAAVVGLIGTLSVIVAGDTQAKYVRKVQPMAAAASEGLMNSADPAPFSVIAGFDSSGKRVVWSLDIPGGLTFLYFWRTTGMVEGINQLQQQSVRQYGPGDYSPLVALEYWSFRAMVALGFLFVALTALGIFIGSRKAIGRWRARLAFVPWLIPLPYLANTAGWILTENGRQPWIVHGLLKTTDGVSPNLVPSAAAASLLILVAVYAALIALDVYLLARTAQAGLAEETVGGGHGS